VTITRRVLADLNLVKAEMSKAQGGTVTHPEALQRLIDTWRQRQKEEAQRT
jgi:hypothetical protein